MILSRFILAFGLLLFNSTANNTYAAPVDERFFGLHVLYTDKAYPDGERSSWPAAKFGSWRIWNSFVSWGELQVSAEQWDFTRLDRYVAWSERAKVEAVYTLGRTPQWAFARPNSKCDGKYNCIAEPPDLRHWENYVRSLARRYKGRIAAYEVWNEPAFSEVDPLYRPDGRPIQYFAGSANQMAEMARIAYQTIKAEDPSAVVVSPGVTSEGNGLRRLETYLKAGGGQWADAIGFHFYTAPPEDAYWQALRVTELLTKYGIGSKPIWNTEMGYVYAKEEFGVSQGPKTGRWTDILDQQTGAAYVARSMILMAAAGIQRVHWFNWDGDPPHPTMGIAAKRPRYNSYDNRIRQSSDLAAERF